MNQFVELVLRECKPEDQKTKGWNKMRIVNRIQTVAMSAVLSAALLLPCIALAGLFQDCVLKPSTYLFDDCRESPYDVGCQGQCSATILINCGSCTQGTGWCTGTQTVCERQVKSGYCSPAGNCQCVMIGDWVISYDNPTCAVGT